jgi:hypothetical protein
LFLIPGEHGGHLDDLNEPRHGRSAEGREPGSTELSHDAGAVRRGLPDLRLRACDVVDQLLGEVALVVEGSRARVLDDVVEDAQAPLVVRPRVIRLLCTKAGSSDV